MDICRGRRPSEHLCSVREAVKCSQGVSREDSEVLASVDQEQAIAGDVLEATCKTRLRWMISVNGRSFKSMKAEQIR